MEIQSITTPHAPAAIGPYSQAIQAGPFLFCSGQISIDPATQTFDPCAGDPAKQMALALANLHAVLKAADCGWHHLVKVTLYLTNLDHFEAVNAVYAATLGDHRPARACVEVSRLPRGALVEIDAIAIGGKL